MLIAENVGVDEVNNKEKGMEIKFTSGAETAVLLLPFPTQLPDGSIIFLSFWQVPESCLRTSAFSHRQQ